MNGKSSLAGALIAMLGLMFYAYSNPSVAVSSGPQTQASTRQSQSANAFAYAQLTVEDDQFIFDQGGLQTPRKRSLTALIRFLGSNEKPTYINLLNAIGSRGWEIVESDSAESIVTFKRRL